jgi:multicomponent Na+:H+ antiporter subunit D
MTPRARRSSLKLVGAPLAALSRPGLHDRLAASTIASNAFVIASAALGAPSAVLGAALQLVAHGLAKTALIMAGGTIDSATGRRDVARLGGLGQRMPWTFAAVAIGALSMAGLAPGSGAWPLLWSVAGAGGAFAAPVVWAFAASAFLQFALLAPAALRAFAEPVEINPFTRPDGATIGCIAPTALAAMASVALVAVVDPLARFLITGLVPP